MIIASSSATSEYFHNLNSAIHFQICEDLTPLGISLRRNFPSSSSTSCHCPSSKDDRSHLTSLTHCDLSNSTGIIPYSSPPTSPEIPMLHCLHLNLFHLFKIRILTPQPILAPLSPVSVPTLYIYSIVHGFIYPQKMSHPFRLLVLPSYHHTLSTSQLNSFTSSLEATFSSR